MIAELIQIRALFSLSFLVYQYHPLCTRIYELLFCDFLCSFLVHLKKSHNRYFETFFSIILLLSGLVFIISFLVHLRYSLIFFFILFHLTESFSYILRHRYFSFRFTFFISYLDSSIHSASFLFRFWIASYSWKRSEPTYPSSYKVNNIAAVLLLGWLWH